MIDLFKIRLLLFLLSVSFAVTALTLHYTFDKNEILQFDAQTLEKNLRSKEVFIKKYLDNKQNFNRLRTAHNDPALASALIDYFRDEHQIYIHTYYNSQLVFWGSNKIAPETDAGLKEGFNRLQASNGWYEAFKKTSGNFSVVCIIPIKSNFPFQNKYLKNEFSSDLTRENNLEIAALDDKDVYNIGNSEGAYLLSVKLKSAVINTFYSNLELTMWLLCILFAIIFTNYVCVSIANKGHIKRAVLLFFLFLYGLRILTLEVPFFDSYFNISLFDPKYFSAGYFLPSLGDFLFNMILVTWFLCFVFSYRKQLVLLSTPVSQTAGIAIFALLGIIFYLAAYQQSALFYQLITRSTINFDLTNIIYLDSNSWIGILLMCISALDLFLLLYIILHLSGNLRLSNTIRFKIFIVGILLMLIIQAILQDMWIYVLLFSLLVLINGWAHFTRPKDSRFIIFLLTVLLFSIVASIKLASFRFIKEREHRKEVAYRLESADDPNAVLLFFDIEQDILHNDTLASYFNEAKTHKEALDKTLNEYYFDGYLSRYDLETFVYSKAHEDDDSNNASLNYFKNLVVEGSIKVSEYFYRINNTFGYQHYFAILPVKEGNKKVGTLVLTLKSKGYKESISIPPVLADNKISNDGALEGYSFAFYLNDRLVTQHGDYIYNLVNNHFSGKLGKFVHLEDQQFSHLIYKPTWNKVIVISSPVTNWIMQLASVSFLFLVVVTFSLLVLAIRQLWLIFHDTEFRRSEIKWRYLVSRNNILYKTRIQASLIAAIVTALLVMGATTYMSLGSQFSKQMDRDILNQLNVITSGFENNKMIKNGNLNTSDEKLLSFARLNAADLNIFDLKGKLLFSTQPRIYNQNLKEPRMGILAYMYLNKLQRSEYLQSERIGSMTYPSAYRPVRDSKNATIAYLNLPNYYHENNYDAKIGDYLNTLINVYALLIVIIVLIAIFLGNQITYPLSIVSQSLRKIKIGGKNEPIQWKRNDEIGTLIKEYNSMIMALEESTNKLARSERESAWKEMARQVAHEIKNPLTPLKLGVQLLERSWKEQDPNFNKKFEKFSKSFIEQIESLALIASEFSNFAKLTDAQFENVNVVDIINKAIAIHSYHHISITLVSDSQCALVSGSPEHLSKIVGNLIKNAIEAIPEDEKGIVMITISTELKEVIIEVKDNGQGIPQELKDKIFSPNFTTKSSGTGLGLAFVKQATENMLGTISFETQDGKGTSFYIRLPLISPGTSAV